MPDQGRAIGKVGSGLVVMWAIVGLGACKQIVPSSDPTTPGPNEPVPVPLVASPESTLGIAPGAIVNLPTTISVLLRDRLGGPFFSDSEVVVIRVTGPNGGADSAFMASYSKENEYRLSLVPSQSGTDTIAFELNGVQLTQSPTLRLVSTRDVAEPIYDPTNSDHVLHVYEDWSNHGTIADLGTARRGDGGSPWIDHGIKRYGSVVNEPDPFGSVRYVTTDYTRDPPVAPHGTGEHAAGYHWYIPGGDPTDDNADAPEKMNRGFTLSAGGYLNKPAKAAVVYEWAVRQRGTNWYEGKNVDINGGINTGVGRFNFDPWNAPLGWLASCRDAVCSTYYTDDGFTPLYAGMPPSYNYTGPHIGRVQGADLQNAIGSPEVAYKQNVGWGTGPGQFSWGAGGVMSGAFNADTRGTSTPMWQAGWLYFKLQITKEAPGTSFGHGRIEMWVGPTPTALVKVMEYLGDVGEVAEGRVWIDPTGTSDQLVGRVAYFGLCSRRYRGGALLDIGTVRIWSHSR